MPRNVTAAPAHDCPGIRIHAIDIVQSPGIVMPSMADIEPHHAMVTAALPANSSAEMPRKVFWDATITCRTRHAGATTHLSRSAPAARDRATDTSPTAHRALA